MPGRYATPNSTSPAWPDRLLAARRFPALSKCACRPVEGQRQGQASSPAPRAHVRALLPKRYSTADHQSPANPSITSVPPEVRAVISSVQTHCRADGAGRSPATWIFLHGCTGCTGCTAARAAPGCRAARAARAQAQCSCSGRAGQKTYPHLVDPAESNTGHSPRISGQALARTPHPASLSPSRPVGRLRV